MSILGEKLKGFCTASTIHGRMKWEMLILLILLILIPLSFLSAEENFWEIMDKVFSFFINWEGEAEFTVDTLPTEGSSMHGKMWKKGNRYVWESWNPYVKVIFDGDTVWEFLSPNAKEIEKIDISELPEFLYKKIKSGEIFKDILLYLKTKSKDLKINPVVKRNKNTILICESEKGEENYMEIDAINYSLKKIQINIPQVAIIKISIKVREKKLPEKLFTYSPSPDVKIIDVTHEALTVWENWFNQLYGEKAKEH